MTKEFAYLLGVFLGDGSIAQNRTFELQTIDKDFAEYTLKRLEVCGRNVPSLKIANRKTSSGSTVYRIVLNDAVFCRSIRESCPDKEHLPIGFHEWSWDLQKEVIEGLMDSEGYVSKYHEHFAGAHKVYQMSVGIGACNGWLEELHTFFQKKQWKVGAVNTSITSSGKEFFKFTFNKSDFLFRDLKFNIARKQKRLDDWRLKFLPGSTTLRGIPKTEEAKRKIGDAHRGKIVSSETRDKMSLAKKLQPPERSPITGRYIGTGNDKV